MPNKQPLSRVGQKMNLDFDAPHFSTCFDETTTMNTLQQPDARPKLLCTDDDPAISYAIAARLRLYGVDVSSAFFGTQGIWLAVTEGPDVIITDMRMPQGTGGHVVQCLKERDDTCAKPIIVLTGTRDSENERQMRALGVADYLHKPLRFQELLAALEKLIELQPSCPAAAGST
jgi:twitching motility two-component system response regulator PilG